MKYFKKKKFLKRMKISWNNHRLDWKQNWLDKRYENSRIQEDKYFVKTQKLELKRIDLYKKAVQLYTILGKDEKVEDFKFKLAHSQRTLEDLITVTKDI